MSINNPHRRRQLKCLLATAAGAAVGLVGSASAAADSSGPPLQAGGAALQPAVVATTNGGPTLGGITSQGGPIVLRLTTKAKALQFAVAAMDLKCASGNEFATVDAFGRLPIKANGQVHAKAVRTFNDGSGDTVKVTHSLSSTINRKRWTASGVWRLRLDVTSATGQTDSCDSGNVGFGAQL